MQTPNLVQLSQNVNEQGAQLRYLTESVLDLRRRVTAISAEWKLHQMGKRPRFPVEFMSQFGEDLFFWELFGGRFEGFYIEVGAYDGYRASVTYAFEAVGWTGLLVEPLPRRFAECAARRAASRVVHSALGKRGASGEIEITAVKDDEWDMSSYTGDHPMQRASLDQTKFEREKVRVPLTSMDAVLEATPGGPPAIDFAMIDVEGSEVDVLEGFDLRKWRPRALMLEDNTFGKDLRLTNYMKGQPYLFFGWLGVNQIYIRNDDQELIRRAPLVRV
ncbi:hypothetical protein PHYC_03558 [Phycisphaerales bacterium]|nr:hypothetical protein PHYC_03558 [Phycisphaerales bacterium]